MGNYFVVKDLLALGFRCLCFGNLAGVERERTVLANERGWCPIRSNFNLLQELGIYPPDWHVADEGEAAVRSRRSRLRGAAGGVRYGVLCGRIPRGARS